MQREDHLMDICGNGQFDEAGFLVAASIEKQSEYNNHTVERRPNEFWNFSFSGFKPKKPAINVKKCVLMWLIILLQVAVQKNSLVIIKSLMD